MIRSSIPGRDNKIFFLSPNVYTGFGVHPGTFPRYKAVGGVKMTTDHLVSRLRISGAVRIIPRRTVMGCIGTLSSLS